MSKTTCGWAELFRHHWKGSRSAIPLQARICREGVLASRLQGTGPGGWVQSALRYFALGR
jgi:hypothetical protein